MLVHPGTKSDLGTCKYCNESFRGKTSLDNHVIKKHPDFITSIKRKIHECSQCNYKTPRKKAMERHTSTHTGAVFKVLICEHCQHCTLTFKSKFSLKDHMVRKHPSFSSSVTIYRCAYCAYGTISTSNLKAHMSNHSSEKPTESTGCKKASVAGTKGTDKTSFNYKITDPKTIQIGDDCNSKTGHYHRRQWVSHRCNYCDLGCSSKQLLDDHVIRKHPEFISTVTTEIYECPYCPYKTTMFGYLKKHTPIHDSDEMSSRKDVKCYIQF
nr:unnamed protein product [Callosobruchus analis]